MKNLVWIVVAAVIAVGGYLLYSGRSVQDLATDVTGAATSAVDATAEVATDAADAVADTAAEAVDAVADTAEAVADTATESAMQ